VTRKLEVQEDFARNTWEFVMTQRVRLQHIDQKQIAAHGWITRETYDSIGKERVKELIERSLAEELDRLEDALYAYDEAYGDTEPPY
jgi:hypothetical protein